MEGFNIIYFNYEFQFLTVIGITSLEINIIGIIKKNKTPVLRLAWDLHTQWKEDEWMDELNPVSWLLSGNCIICADLNFPIHHTWFTPLQYELNSSTKVLRRFRHFVEKQNSITKGRLYTVRKGRYHCDVKCTEEWIPSNPHELQH